MNDTIWTMGMGLMYATAGKDCVATIDSVTIHFKAILDRVQVEDEDETGRYVRNDSALRVTKDIARKLQNRTLVPLKVEGVEYVISECKSVDDGEEALCLIIPKDEFDRGYC